MPSMPKDENRAAAYFKDIAFSVIDKQVIIQTVQVKASEAARKGNLSFDLQVEAEFTYEQAQYLHNLGYAFQYLESKQAYHIWFG